MEKIQLQDKYPVYQMEIKKEATTYGNVDEIIKYLQQKVDEHPVATNISVFDHFEHTKGVDGGVVAEDIVASKNAIFCFGMKLPNPGVMSVRPRSIGVTEMADGRFVVNFLEAPVEAANDSMQEWVKGIENG